MDTITDFKPVTLIDRHFMNIYITKKIRKFCIVMYQQSKDNLSHSLHYNQFFLIDNFVWNTMTFPS